MFPFVVLLLLPLAMQHIRVKGLPYQKKNHAALQCFFVIFTMLIALRHENIGKDTETYADYFMQYSKMSWEAIRSIPYERGFVYYNKLISLISKDPQFYFAVTGVIISAMIYPTYSRLLKDSALTISIFCILSTFVMAFSGIRQMIAIAMGVAAYEFVRKKKPIPYVLIVLVAISFHSSAFMLAFMYPLYHAKITRKWLFVLIPVLVAIFIWNDAVFSALGLILERYSRFETEVSNTGSYTMLILFALFAVISFILPDDEKLSREVIGLRNFLLLSIVLQMFVPLHMLAMRMNYYYIIFIPLLIPEVIAARSERWAQIGTTARHIMVGFFLLYFFFTVANGGALDVFPYHFFWENV